MEEIQIEMKWKLKTTDLKVCDALMRKMLKSLNVEELDLIADCKLTKTLAEVTINAAEE